MEYSEVNSNFRMLTDIRFKLLAFLPLAAVASVAALQASRGSTPDLGVNARTLALSLFGLVVTAGLATYNARNDQIYLWLVTRGALIERELGLPDGSFAHRPNAWFDIRIGRAHWHVGHVSSVTLIYTSSVGLWIFGCLVAGAQFAWGSDSVPAWMYATAIGLPVVLTAYGSVMLRKVRVAREESMRHASETAIALATEISLARGDDVTGVEGYREFVDVCAELIGPDRKRDARVAEIESRIAYYADMAEDERRRFTRAEIAQANAAANYLSLIVDLPPTLLRSTPRRR